MKKAVNYASVLLLMLLGAYPQLALLCESFGCSITPRFWLWFLALALCLWFSACFRRGILLGMPLSAGILYAAWRSFQGDPLAELQDLADRIAAAYYTHYYASGGEYRALGAVEDHSFLMLLAAYLLLAYLSSSLTSRSGRRIMSLLGTIPVFAACLAVNGTPAYTPVVTMLLFWALLMLGGGRYDAEGQSGRIVFLAGAPVLLMLTVLLLVSKPQEYRFDERDAALSREFDRIGDWISRWIDERVGGTGPTISGIVWEAHEESPQESPQEEDALLWGSPEGGLDLTLPGAQELLEKVYLRVRAENSGLLYLRALSYGDYLGTGWQRAEEGPVSSLDFSARAVSQAARTQRIDVQRLSTLRYACLPYYTPLSGGSDASVEADAAGSRLSYYRYTGGFEGLATTREDELLYRDFAHEVYTRLPEQTRSALLALAAEAGLDGNDEGIVDAVAAYIRAAGEYDLETGAYLSADYAVCFLTQARRGYCVHFATAATAMYRALGIPARITEGFLVQTEAGRYVDVKGANAHAWVEVYRDGIGWVPVEVTGQSGLLPEESEPSPQPEEPTPAPDTPDTPDAPVTEQPMSATPEEKPGQAALPVGVISGENQEQTMTQRAPALSQKRLWPILLLCLPFAALPLWRRLRRAIRRRGFSQRDANRAAVALWRCAQRVERFGGSIPAGIQNCAEKAVFSAKGISEEERIACRALLERMIDERDAALDPLRRFAFRYLYGLK